MLKPGDRIPEFEGQALFPEGEIEDIALGDYRGKWVTLFFWPLDFTFVCPTEIRGFEELAAEFEKRGCELLGASIDSVYVRRAWVEHGLGPVSFPLIGDVNKSLARGFGVLDPQGVALRATFIISPEGVIESVMANGLNVGRSAAETLRLVAAFQSGELTACEWQPGQQFVKAA
jgi:alkyl hydroperoxide reductase subunit AhpC